ncbi:MAG: hypothetical protein RIF32_16665 [Leptospirales bacterium]|jgi:hypothetical protein
MDFVEFAAKCIEDEELGQGFLAELEKNDEAQLKNWLESKGYAPSAEELQRLLKHRESLKKIDGPLKGY